MNNRATDEALKRVADQYGTPAYVYFADRIGARIARLEQAFENRFTLSYAVKCNPNPALLSWLRGRIDHLDISSTGELRLALAAGWDPARITFTGPGKQLFEIAEAIACGVGALVIESEREAALASRLAMAAGHCQAVVVRIAPDVVPKGFGDQMAGRPSPFGIDIETASVVLPRIVALPGLRIKGFHIYSGTQCLKPEAITENYRIFLNIFETLCRDHRLRPEMLIMGSGLGVPYHEQDTPLDLGAVAQGTVAMLDIFQADPRFKHTRLVLELGRYLVAESGYYLTRVTSTKESRGTRFAICDGGMNHHLPASGNFGMVIRRNYCLHKVGGIGGPERIDLVGPLCTSIDRLASNAELPRVEAGDLIAIHNSGAYGLTASPVHFISHAPPLELFVLGDEIQDVSQDFGSRGAMLCETSLLPSMAAAE